MNCEYKKQVQGLNCLIGNTPLLEIEYEYRGKRRKIYAKAEHMNMTGSIKDRMAFHIIKNAIESNQLKASKPIIEATSGNTGISISAIGRALGHPVTIFMPDWMSRERINLIEAYGAQIILVSKEEGGFLGSIDKANKLAASIDGSYLPCQFSNNLNVEAHYLTTGPEIWWQLKLRQLMPDAFVAGVGTGGTIMGVGQFLKEQKNDIKAYPLEPSNSPTLSTGHKVGKHRIQGVSDEFIPQIVDLDKLDSIINVDDGDSIIMAQKLSNIGLGVGISSGANFLGAVKIQEELGCGSVVTTVFADDNKKYLSTDLLKKEPVREDFLSSEIRLIHFNALKRVCYLCCNPEECVESRFNFETQTIQPAYCPKCTI